MKSEQDSEAALPNKGECQKCIDKLLDYEEGLLSESEASHLKKHLEECSWCRQYQHSWIEVWNNLDKAFPRELEPAPDFKIRFWKKVGQEADRGKAISLEAKLKAQSKYLGYWRAFTAVASLVVVGGTLLWSAFAFNFTSETPAASLVATADTSKRQDTIERLSAPLADSASELRSDEPYYTDYVLADEFGNNADEDLSNSVIYADYEPDYIMSQGLLDMAFDEAANSAY